MNSSNGVGYSSPYRCLKNSLSEAKQCSQWLAIFRK
jgi:hypothetical protein